VQSRTLERTSLGHSSRSRQVAPRAHLRSLPPGPCLVRSKAVLLSCRSVRVLRGNGPARWSRYARSSATPRQRYPTPARTAHPELTRQRLEDETTAYSGAELPRRDFPPLAGLALLESASARSSNSAARPAGRPLSELGCMARCLVDHRRIRDRIARRAGMEDLARQRLSLSQTRSPVALVRSARARTDDLVPAIGANAGHDRCEHPSAIKVERRKLAGDGTRGPRGPRNHASTDLSMLINCATDVTSAS
jgi:hypothetical protein